MDDKDKLIEILKATIEDYRTLVVKYKESEALRDKMIENLGDCILVLDTVDRVVDMNT